MKLTPWWDPFARRTHASTKLPRHSRQRKNCKRKQRADRVYLTYTSTDFASYVFGLDVVPHSSRGVQRPTDRIFICHRRRIESNFTRETFVNGSGKFCCTANMKGQTSKNWRSILVSILWTRLTLENWRAKLISLLLAITVWYLINKNVGTTLSVSERPSPTPVTKTR